MSQVPFIPGYDEWSDEEGDEDDRSPRGHGEPRGFLDGVLDDGIPAVMDNQTRMLFYAGNNGGSRDSAGAERT